MMMTSTTTSTKTHSYPSRGVVHPTVTTTPSLDEDKDAFPSQSTASTTTRSRSISSSSSAGRSHSHSAAISPPPPPLATPAAAADSTYTYTFPPHIDPSKRTYSSSTSATTSASGGQGQGQEQWYITATGDHVDRESLHAPGAVQRFGCLFALEEEESTGNFRVNSCSENTLELLSIAPSAFFSASSFTEFLSSSSIDTFLDAIDAMHASDPSSSSSSSEEGASGSEGLGMGLGTDRNRDEDLPKSPLTRIKIPPEHFKMTLVSSTPSSSSASGSRGQGQGQGQGEKKRTPVFASLHRPSESEPWRTLLELEPVLDVLYPRSASSSCASFSEDNSAGAGMGRTPPTAEELAQQATQSGFKLDNTAEEIFKSTLSAMRPLRALSGGSRAEGGERRRARRADGAERRTNLKGAGNLKGRDEVNLVQLVYQVEQQFRKAKTLEAFLPVAAAIIKELTGFDRCCIIQINSSGDGLVLSEQLDLLYSRSLYLGHTFPAADLCAASHDSSRLSMVYDVDAQPARMVSRSKEEMDRVSRTGMGRCPLRAPTKGRCDFLRQTSTRSTLSISLLSFSSLWGLITLSSYGPTPHRVTPSIRQLCAYLGESLGRTIERLTYERRLKARRLITISATKDQPTEAGLQGGTELLKAFRCDFGALSVGQGSKVFGEIPDTAEFYRVLGYLRANPVRTRVHSQEISVDFPSLRPPHSSSSSSSDSPAVFKTIAGILVIPLSSDTNDFMLLCKKPDQQQVIWAGSQRAMPGAAREGEGEGEEEEGQKTFKVWRTTSVNRSTPWDDEVIDIAAILGTIYSRSLSLWKEKDQAVQANSVTSLLLSNASNEVRTPLNAILNYLELAVGTEANADLEKTLSATKSLVKVINNLLDLSKHERNVGEALYSSQVFELRATIDEALSLHVDEAKRRGLSMEVVESPQGTPSRLIGDADKVRTIISTAVNGALKHTTTGSVTVIYGEIPDSPADESETAVARKDSIRIAISIIDTGEGIEPKKLESIFAELHSIRKSSSEPTALGLGLATSARIVEGLQGQLLVESEPGKGSKFTYILPFLLSDEAMPTSPLGVVARPLGPAETTSPTHKTISPPLATTYASDDMFSGPKGNLDGSGQEPTPPPSRSSSRTRARPSLRRVVTLHSFSSTSSARPEDILERSDELHEHTSATSTAPTEVSAAQSPRPGVIEGLKILVVEDDKINRVLIQRRLTLARHHITLARHGGEAVRAVEEDPTFDLILMDLNMPICDGYEASSIIRKSEPNYIFPLNKPRPFSHVLNNGIPIIAVTANSQEKNRQSLIESGIDGWCLKPIRFARLNELIAGAVDPVARQEAVYQPGEWEQGGWLESKRLSKIALGARR